MEKQKKLSERQKNVEFDIKYWRERFAQVKQIAPKNWQDKLAEYNSAYDTREGGKIMTAVANKRAGLAKTAQLVEDLEEMVTAPEKPKTVFDKWKKKELLTGK